MDFEGKKSIVDFNEHLKKRIDWKVLKIVDFENYFESCEIWKKNIFYLKCFWIVFLSIYYTI